MNIHEKQKPNDKYTPAQVINALEAAGGVKSIAAQKLGCAWNTIKSYVERYELIAEALVEIEEGMKDLAETQLISLIRDKHPAAVFFYLKTKAKDRGYSERFEATGPNGGPVPVAFNAEAARDEMERKLDRIAESRGAESCPA